MGALLPGIKGLLNLHPLFTHFPIAFWVGALLFEAIAVFRSSDDWHKNAARLLYLGTLAGLAAVGTGLLAEESIPEKGPVHDIFEFHEEMMYITTSVAAGLCLFAFFLRKNFTTGYRKLMLLGLVVLAGLLTVGADRGAQMVFEYGAGVDWSKAAPKK